LGGKKAFLEIKKTGSTPRSDVAMLNIQNIQSKNDRNKQICIHRGRF
jgi:hypothetical protein